MSLTTIGLALVMLACRGLTSPVDPSRAANHPLTWAQLLAASPNVGIPATHGAVVLEAGSSWPGFRGNVAALSIGVNGATTTFDFESAQHVPAQVPDTISNALWDSLTAPANLMTDPPGMRGTWVRNVMMITFKRTATHAERQAVIDLIQGEIVGGNPPFGDDGEYIVRIPYATAPGDSVSGPILRAFLALRGHPSLVAAYPIGMDRGIKLHDRRPIDGGGFNVWPASRDSGTGPNRGQDTVNAPFARPASGPILPPDSVPHALFDSLGTVMASIPGIEPGPYRRDIVVVRFEPETPLAVRMAVIDSISGHVVGGHVDPEGQNGSYFVRISGGTFDALVEAVDILQRQTQVAFALWWGLFIPDIQS